jgi:uncharacterized Tic20 family protein
MSNSDNPYAKPMNLSPSSERLLSVLIHLVGIPFEFFGPLVGWLIFKDQGRLVSHHSKESFNFGLTMLLSFVFLAVSIVGLLVIWVIPIVFIIFRIIAAVKASQGEFYKYPLAIRFIK